MLTLGAVALLALVLASPARAGSAPTFASGYSAGADDDWMYFAWDIDPQGSDTTYHYEYKVVGAPTWTSTPTRSLPAVSGMQDVPDEIVTGVEPATDYVFKTVATNEFGTSESAEGVTRTRDAAPQARTGMAVEVTATSARLTGFVNPRGNSTSWWFDYGPAGGGEADVQMSGNMGRVGPDGGEVPVEATLTGLQPETAYRFRLRVSANDTGYPEPGDFVGFTTPAAPPAEPAPLPPPSEPVPPPSEPVPPPVAAAAPTPLPAGGALASTRTRTPGFHCRALPRKRLRGAGRTPFAMCVTALRALASGKARSPRTACRSLSRRRRPGQKRSDFAACVTAGTRLLQERR